MKSKPKKNKYFILILLWSFIQGLVILTTVLYVKSITLMILWNWFVMEYLELNHMGLHKAVGITIMVSLIKGDIIKYINSVGEEYNEEEYSKEEFLTDVKLTELRKYTKNVIVLHSLSLVVAMLFKMIII